MAPVSCMLFETCYETGLSCCYQLYSGTPLNDGDSRANGNSYLGYLF